MEMQKVRVASRETDRSVVGLAGGGVLLLLVAGAFLWVDFAVNPEWLLAIAAAAATGIGLLRRSTYAILGQMALLGCGLIGGVFYGAVRSDVLLAGVVVAALGATAHALSNHFRRDADPFAKQMAAHTWTLATLLASGALYFRFITLGVGSEQLVRRLVLTLTWLAIGLAVVVFRSSRGRWHAGYLFVAVAVGKALVYDTVHLDGALRIATLGLAGLLLLGGSYWMSRRRERLAVEGA
jgi:hypothetical protein